MYLIEALVQGHLKSWYIRSVYVESTCFNKVTGRWGKNIERWGGMTVSIKSDRREEKKVEQKKNNTSSQGREKYIEEIEKRKNIIMKEKENKKDEDKKVKGWRGERRKVGSSWQVDWFCMQLAKNQYK